MIHPPLPSRLRADDRPPAGCDPQETTNTPSPVGAYAETSQTEGYVELVITVKE